MNFFADSITFITELSTDTLLIFFLIVGMSIATLYLGKHWTVALIVSLFIARFLFSRIPFDLPLNNGWYVFGTILIIALLVSTTLRRFITSDFPYKRSKKYTQSILLGLTATVTLLATGLTEAYAFSPFISRWFTGDFLFWSSLVPFAVLFLFIRK